jgi:hypothetical protein
MKIIAGLMLLASLCLAIAGSVPAQPAAPTAPTETPRPGPPADAFGRTTPRGTVVGYLGAMRDRDFARAAEYLDLRRVPRSQRESQGTELARQLKIVLDQNVSLDPDVVSDAPEGRRDDEMPPALERLTTIHTEKGPVDIVLERVRRDDGALVWKFSAATIARVPALYDEFGRGPLGDVLPSVLFEQRLFEIALWQWIHPEPLWTRFVNFGSSTLDVEVFAYAATADQKEFFAIREDIYLRIMDIVRESGTGFAFPSQTMYVRRDGPLDDEKRGTAEAQVRVWRAESELGLPEFSAQRIAALARPLEYPPEGAASRQAAR